MRSCTIQTRQPLAPAKSPSITISKCSLFCLPRYAFGQESSYSRVGDTNFWRGNKRNIAQVRVLHRCV